MIVVLDASEFTMQMIRPDTYIGLVTLGRDAVCITPLCGASLTLSCYMIGTELGSRKQIKWVPAVPYFFLNLINIHAVKRDAMIGRRHCVVVKAYMHVSPGNVNAP